MNCPEEGGGEGGEKKQVILLSKATKTAYRMFESGGVNADANWPLRRRAYILYTHLYIYTYSIILPSHGAVILKQNVGEALWGVRAGGIN